MSPFKANWAVIPNHHNRNEYTIERTQVMYIEAFGSRFSRTKQNWPDKSMRKGQGEGNQLLKRLQKKTCRKTGPWRR